MTNPFSQPHGSRRGSVSRYVTMALVILAFLTTVFFLLLSPVMRNHASPIFLPDISRTKSGLAPDHLGSVASESSICSQIGIDLLREGGNAADALVGTVFCTGVIGMHHSGIGGGGFMLVRGSNGSYEFIDFRESAPASYFQDMYNNNANASIWGGLASGVPGEVRGLAYLHDNYGALPWQQVMQGAIKTARYGWSVTEDMVRYMDAATAHVSNFLVEDPTWALDFAPNGTRVGLGDTITRRRYADTLETIANNGPDAFYTGAIAENTIKALRAANGTMTIDDLKDYAVALLPLMNITYRDFRLYSGGSPSSGAVALEVMKIVEGYEDFFHTETTNLSTHRLVEAMRFAYGKRASLGDPLFVDGITEFENEMISEDTVEQIRTKINDKHTLNVSAYSPDGFETLENHGTSQIVTADHSGMAITLTTTINLFFGSTLMVPETGVIMNNEMNDFSIPNTKNVFGYIPSPTNYIVPGKRPLSSITPVIVEFLNGTLYYVIGAAGGSRIITATIQNLVHVLDRNMTAPEAVAQPRLHDQLIPNQVSFEYSFNKETVASMKGRGHNVTFVGSGQSAVQGIRRHPNGTFEAAGESRQINSGGFAI